MTDSANEKRTYLRVNAGQINLLFEPVKPEQAAEVEKEILAQPPNMEDLEIETDRLWHQHDPAERMEDHFTLLFRFLQKIDAKMDYLIDIAERRRPVNPPSANSYLVDISGTGIAFLCPQQIPQKTLLKLHLQFSRFPVNEILALAEVKWAKPQKTKEGKDIFETGAEFTAIHESDREKIFRFISKIERQMLRDRKEAKQRKEEENG